MNTCKTQCGTVLQCYSSEFSFIYSTAGKWTHMTKSVINKSVQRAFYKQDMEQEFTICMRSMLKKFSITHKYIEALFIKPNVTRISFIVVPSIHDIYTISSFWG